MQSLSIGRRFERRPLAGARRRKRGTGGRVLRRCRLVWRRTETQSPQMVRNSHQPFSGIEFLQAVNADPNCPRNSAP